MNKLVSAIAFVLVTLTVGCNEPLSSGNNCFDPATGQSTGLCVDGAVPDSGMTPDGGTNSDKIAIVEGLIYEASVGTVSNVNVIDGNVANVLVSACDITSRPARNGWRPFRCQFNIAAGRDFLVRYNSPGRNNYAVVTNYNLTTFAWNDAEFIIVEVKDGGSSWTWDNYHRAKFDGAFRDLTVTPATRATATAENTARLRF